MSLAVAAPAAFVIGDRVLYQGSVDALFNQTAYVVGARHGRFTLVFDSGDVADRVRPTSIWLIPTRERDHVVQQAVAVAARCATR